MSNEFEYMLELFINGSFGKKTVLEDNINITKILEESKLHSLYYPIVNSLLLSMPKTLESDTDLREKLRKDLKGIRFKTYLIQIKLFEILRIFEEKKIPYALLKGYSVAFLYNDPYSRNSSDIDIIVNKNDEKKAIDILLKYGFAIKKLNSHDDKHDVLYHPQLGTLELHVSLYNKKTSDIWFNKSELNFQLEFAKFTFDDLEKIKVEGSYFYTLNVDKKIEFLFLHNVKHFILGGSSIKAIMDFFLTYIKEPHINYSMFNDKIKMMSFDTLFSVMLSSIEKYISFDEINIPFYKKCDSKLVDMFLADMDIGKWFGYNSKTNDSKVGWRTYEDSKSSMRDSYTAKIRNMVNLIFPPINRLRNNYKYAMRFPILIPISWAHRLIKNIFYIKKRRNVQILKEQEYRRVDLFKQMKLL